MGELVEGGFGQGSHGIPPEIADAADVFVTFRLLRSELRFVPADEFEDAAADLMDLAAEQHTLLRALSSEDRGRAIHIGRQQLYVERTGFPEPPNISEVA